jgi:hypothetical protein
MPRKPLRSSASPRRAERVHRNNVPGQRPGRKSVVLGGLLVGLLLSALGIIQLRGGSTPFGALAVVIGPVLFLTSSSQLGRFTFSRKDMPLLMNTWIPALLIILAVFFTAISANDVAHRTVVEKTQVAINTWIGSLICLVAGIHWYEHWRPHPGAWVDWIRDHLQEFLLVLGLVVVAVLARVVLLEQHPYPWSGDEATVGMESLLRLRTPYPDVFNSGWSGNPFPSFFPTGIAQIFLGSTIFAVRLPSALAGSLTVLFLYLLTRELFDKDLALIAAAFLSTFPYHLHFSRIGVMTIQDPLVAAFTLWLVVRALHRDSLSAYLWAGIATGLTFYTYVGGRLVLPLAFAAFFFVAIRRRGYLRTHIRQLGIYTLSTIVSIAPMAAFWLLHMQDFFSRFNQVSIIPSGWLAAELTHPGRTLGGILLDQFARTTLAYIGWSAGGNFFNSPQPYLTILGSLFFLFGMGIAIQRWRDPASLILLTWFWTVVFIGGVFTITPPASTRLVMTIPAVAIFVAIGVKKVLDVVTQFRISVPLRRALGVLLVGILVLQNAYFYFGPYRVGSYFDDANGEVAMQAGIRLKDLGSEYTLVMVGAPRMFSDFPTIRFLAPGNRRTDIDPTRAASADLSQYLPAFVVATPSNLQALQTVAANFPGGVWETIPSQTRNEMLYFGYVLGESAQRAKP